jgi:hypothetical protein
VASSSSLEERIIIHSLPHPIAKVTFTYATLDDEDCVAQLIIFCSISVYDFSGYRIAYFQSLEAVCPPSPLPSNNQRAIPSSNFQRGILPEVMAGRGHNPTHGYDEGPPPPGMMPGGTPQYPSQGYFPGPVPMANAAFQVCVGPIPLQKHISKNPSIEVFP